MAMRTLYSLVCGMIAFTVTSSIQGWAGQIAQTAKEPPLQSEEGAAPQRPSKFTLIRMANGTSKDGAPFSQNTFERMPGERVYVLMIHFPSADTVRKEFAVRLKESIKIIEQNKLTSKNGATEERAVVTLKAKDGQVLTVIVSTAGAVLREIQSYSEQAALEFEQQAKANDSDLKR